MPKLHERLRHLLPDQVLNRIPEKLKPPAWREPQFEIPDWWKNEQGSLQWVPGTPAKVYSKAPGASGGTLATQDSKGHRLGTPVRLEYGTEGTVTAIGPDFLVFQPHGWDHGVRVPKTDLLNLVPEKERKARRIIEVTAAELE